MWLAPRIASFVTQMCNKITYIFSKYGVGPKQIAVHWLTYDWRKKMQQLYNGGKSKGIKELSITLELMLLWILFSSSLEQVIKQHIWIYKAYGKGLVLRNQMVMRNVGICYLIKNVDGELILKSF